MSARKGGDGRGGFFAVDRRSWAFVCSLGLNAAVGYLVMARGTGPDQATTSWSVNAIENYTGIGRKRADQAIELLLQRGAVTRLQAGRRPRYRIPRAWEINGVGCFRPPLDANKSALLERFRKGEPPGEQERGFGPKRKSTARALVLDLWDKGYLELPQRDTGDHDPDEVCRASINMFRVTPAVEPEWIWLPNTLIDGAASEKAPVELLRQTGKVAWLRLFIELYRAHDLADEGSIPWRQGGFWWSFTRKRIGQRGQHVVFAFEQDRLWISGAPFYVAPLCKRDTSGVRDPGEFFKAMGQLVDFGLIQKIGLVLESSDQVQTEVLHSCALPGGDGLECEQAVTRDGYDAALELLNEGQQKGAEGDFLIPVESHRTDVQLIGVARLRYRPQTAPTAQWLSKTMSRCEKWSSLYREPQANRDAAD